jgi:HSP20 family protein
MLPILLGNPVFAPLAAGPFNRLDAVFDRLVGEDSLLGRSWAGVPLAMWEDDEHIYMESELPGVSESDVEVTVQNGLLFIRGERKPEANRTYLYNGRAYGRFERVITLPEAVHTEDVQARLSDGVLHLALPKSPEARPRRIALQTC